MTLDELIADLEFRPNIMNALQEGFVVADSLGYILYHNLQAAELLNGEVPDHDLKGKRLFLDFGIEVPDQKTKLLEEALKTGEAKKSTRVKYVRVDGEEGYLNIQISPLKGYEAVGIGFVDVTKDVVAAIKDGLTGVYSQSHYRIELKDRAINDAIRSSSKPEERYLGVIGIDLKDFKRANDEKGHHIGDKILVDTAKLLQSAVRKTDYVVRDGGDEFVILCPGADEEAVKAIMGKIYAFVSQYNLSKDDPLLKINMYMVGKVANTNYERLFEKVNHAINLQKRNSR